MLRKARAGPQRLTKVVLQTQWSDAASVMVTLTKYTTWSQETVDQIVTEGTVAGTRGTFQNFGASSGTLSSASAVKAHPERSAAFAS